ncbi:hypothetical protein [Nafulsella turpanensis]|uniref:hypothetical protein n=1 Tax=Nafulsella turpanensis TaxID=1265690 RepID=UPI00034BAFAD|nr:hypothetical protein [Nafulsella turpanensis]
MKTGDYNPSVFEVNLASAILECKDEIQKKLKDNMKIVEVSGMLKQDNPIVTFQLLDEDGDQHEVVVKVIQRPDRH